MKKQFSDDMVPRKMAKGDTPSVTTEEQQKIGSPAPDKAGKSKNLKYGDGQREQYGEGSDYRPEDKTAAADNMGQSDAFAGGEDKKEKGATSRKAKGGLPEEQPPTKK